LPGLSFQIGPDQIDKAFGDLMGRELTFLEIHHVQPDMVFEDLGQ
jgi:hypothetical protein